MRFIVNAFPDGTGRLIFASNLGSTGTMAMPHTIRPGGRAGNSGLLSAFRSGGAIGTAGSRSGVEGGANNLANSGDEKF
jgi:hypothetical protein